MRNAVLHQIEEKLHSHGKETCDLSIIVMPISDTGLTQLSVKTNLDPSMIIETLPEKEVAPIVSQLEDSYRAIVMEV